MIETLPSKLKKEPIIDALFEMRFTSATSASSIVPGFLFSKLQGKKTIVRLGDLRFHDLRHTWASWHRQSGTSVDELKELGGWKSRSMVDRYAKYATEHLAAAAKRIENGRRGNVVALPLRIPHGDKTAA